MGNYRRILRHRDYRLLWSGATVSALGDGMSFVALVWLLIERGGNPATVGWLAAAYTAPVVIGGLAAGVALDRFDRRFVLMGDNLARGLAIASIPVAGLVGGPSTVHLFVVAAVYGLLFMVSLAGVPSLIPSLVDDDELTTANAMESLSYGIAGLSGPAIAGVVIAVAGAPLVLALDAATYGVFVLCLLAMRPMPTEAPSGVGGADVPEATSSPGADATPGLRPAFHFVLRTPAILAITVIYMTINVGEGIFIVLAPVYAREVLGGGAATYGVLVSAFTAGTLLGAALVGAVRWRLPLGRSIAAGTTLTGVALSLLLIRPPLAGTVVVLVAAGLCASSLTAWAQTIRMRLIPPHLRGRVFALLRTLMQSTPPIGAITGGALLALGHVTPAIAVMAGVMAVPGLVGLVLPALGRSATGEAIEAAGAVRAP